MNKQPDSIAFMKPFFCKTAIALSLTLPAAANAAEYVCNVEGITVYASYQINDACRIVETNNVTENSVVAIPGDTPVLKTVQTTEFKASAADYVHASQATPAVQTPVVVARNEYGVPTPISIPIAQARLTSQIDKNVADGLAILSDTAVLDTAPTIKSEIDTTDVLNVMSATTQPQTMAVQTPNNTPTPITQTLPTTSAIQLPQTIIQNPVVLPKTPDKTTAKQNNQTIASDEAIDKTPIKVETKRKGKAYTKTSTRYNAKNTNTGKTTVANTANEQTIKTVVAPTVESNVPNKPATTVFPVDQSKTSAQTPFPKAYTPAANIPFDPSNVYNDIKILPHIPITSVTNTAEAANPRLNITLRNRQNKSRSSSYSKYKAPVIRTAPVVTPAPKPSPKETRKQILQTEVRNEQAAITHLQTQLNAAKQKGDQIKIQQLTRTINARKANIRAIQGEMSR
ncbi:hypothetical protein [Neisseria subflava]|uniref:hypothetical protein n=1 Tax=Neisseria subflava TaxID=28449 RepID=UPI0027E1E42A|nr:hypothetical protein [Neisseria subflava]